MRPKPENVNVSEPPQQSIHPISSYTEPWWRNMGYNPTSAPMKMTGKCSSNPNPLECADGVSESSDDQSMSGDLGEEDDGVSKETHIISPPSPAATFSQEQHNRQHAASNMPTMQNEPVTQPRQLELIGHSMTCAANPYQDPCMGRIMATYGHQPLFYPPFPGMPHGRMPLPLEMAQEPVFVNAKQYQGIIRRRQARAKAEVEKKLVKDRKPYLHESRHQHAMRRPRGSGGRFEKKNKIDTLNCPAEERGTTSSHSASHLALEPWPQLTNRCLLKRKTSGQRLQSGESFDGEVGVKIPVNGGSCKCPLEKISS